MDADRRWAKHQDPVGLYSICPNFCVRLLTAFSRETIKRLLGFPADTNIVWKSHDDSIAQRSAIDHARSEKAAAAGTNPGAHLGSERRRATGHEDSDKAKGTSIS